jgi:hypothetical protein
MDAGQSSCLLRWLGRSKRVHTRILCLSDFWGGDTATSYAHPPETSGRGEGYQSVIQSLAPLSDSHETITPRENKQNLFKTAVATYTYNILLSAQSKPRHLSELPGQTILAAAADHSGDWLHTVAISSYGLRLTDEATCVAVGYV